MDSSTERAAFAAAIAKEPGDLTARLVFADWLDEHGEPDLAALMRAYAAIVAAEGETRQTRRTRPDGPGRTMLGDYRRCRRSTSWLTAAEEEAAGALIRDLAGPRTRPPADLLRDLADVVPAYHPEHADLRHLVTRAAAWRLPPQAPAGYRTWGHSRTHLIRPYLDGSHGWAVDLGQGQQAGGGYPSWVEAVLAGLAVRSRQPEYHGLSFDLRACPGSAAGTA